MGLYFFLEYFTVLKNIPKNTNLITFVDYKNPFWQYQYVSLYNSEYGGGTWRLKGNSNEMESDKNVIQPGDWVILTPIYLVKS